MFPKQELLHSDCIPDTRGLVDLSQILVSKVVLGREEDIGTLKPSTQGASLLVAQGFQELPALLAGQASHFGHGRGCRTTEAPSLSLQCPTHDPALLEKPTA